MPRKWSRKWNSGLKVSEKLEENGRSFRSPLFLSPPLHCLNACNMRACMHACLIAYLVLDLNIVQFFFLSMRDLLDLIHFFGDYYFNRPVHGFFSS